MPIDPPALAFKITEVTAYSYVASLVILAYDAFHLFTQEVEHIYSGPFMNIKAFYVLVRCLTAVDFIFYLYIYRTTPVPPSVCKAAVWITGLTRHVAYTCVIKTLFVLRLRALYGIKNVWISISLGIAMGIEIIVAVSIFLFVSILMQVRSVLFVPYPGCIVTTPETIYSINRRAAFVLWGSKVVCNGFEAALTLIKLYQSLVHSNRDILTGFERMRYWRPILCIFYRDGTLFFIPLFVISVLELLRSSDMMETETSWTPWLSVIYCIGGARRILNILISSAELSDNSGENQLSSINRLSTVNTFDSLQRLPQSSKGARPCSLSLA